LAGGDPVDSGPKLVLVDTNIFVIDLRYRRDPLYSENRRFLASIEKSDNAFTTLVNLYELCGILSFNLNHAQLTNLWVHFPRRYRVTVLPTPDLEAHLPALEQRRVFDCIAGRSSFRDALMVSTAESYMPFVSTLVTWDKEHLHGVFPGDVLSPSEYLEVE
jgi:predicted nucleic acid-binding protein